MGIYVSLALLCGEVEGRGGQDMDVYMDSAMGIAIGSAMDRHIGSAIGT